MFVDVLLKEAETVVAQTFVSDVITNFWKCHCDSFAVDEHLDQPTENFGVGSLQGLVPVIDPHDGPGFVLCLSVCLFSIASHQGSGIRYKQQGYHSSFFGAKNNHRMIKLAVKKIKA
jgi:hypothetical protein